VYTFIKLTLFITHSTINVGHHPPSSDKPILYGIGDVHAIHPINPYTSSYNFLWPEDKLSSAPLPLLDELVAPPAIHPPQDSGHLYPMAPSYQLCQDNRYQRCCAYVTDFHVSTKAIVADKLLRLITPPGIDCHVEDGQLVVDPIPGMILMPPGIPFANRINGSEKHLITIACVQTVDSMQQYSCGSEIKNLADQFVQLAFGKPAAHGQPAIPAIYDLGLKHNDRSAKHQSDPRNGSSSMATTKIEGDGRGTIAPAVQVHHSQLQSLLQVCYALYQHIVPACISKFEYDMLAWIFKDNNVPGFGGPNTNNTGLQVNVSSDIGELASMIGQVQGRLHTDINDYHPAFTLMTLALRLPPGK
jgi:hypothetical protein